MDMNIWYKAWRTDGWWVGRSHCYESRSSTGNICVCHAPEIPTIPDLSHSRLGKKWTECIDKEWLRELKKREKEACWNKVSFVLSQSTWKCSNMWTGRTWCSTQDFALLVSQDMSTRHLRLPGLCRSGYNEWSQCGFVKWDVTVQASYQGAGEEIKRIFGVLPNDLTQKIRSSIKNWYKNNPTSFNKTFFRSFNIVRVLALPQDDHICRLKKPEACFRIHKRSPWLAENGRGVQHSAQVRESWIFQCFCQVAFA